MAIKKSELYSSLWASCDELRGSMDASQYKDYVLVMLFMKYVSDKKDPLIEIPADASFYDMVKHRGKADIGDKINKIIGEFNNSAVPIFFIVSSFLLWKRINFNSSDIGVIKHFVNRLFVLYVILYETASQ